MHRPAVRLRDQLVRILAQRFPIKRVTNLAVHVASNHEFAGQVGDTANGYVGDEAERIQHRRAAHDRERIDQRIAGLGVNVAHLARDLKALLAVPARDGWDGGQEEGHIDGRRLAQLVASPTERRLFRTERDEARADCLMTILIDCSGSMKEHIESVAVLVDVLVRALEQAGVASEVLGFTTNAWNGGRAQRDWVRGGRPAHPGRLNEVCHMVFKDAATSWRRARLAIAAHGLNANLVHKWRRGCGSPMDSATNLANDAHYLDHHLKDQVARFEARGAEIYGVGVGLDLSPYYSRSHVLDLSGSVGSALFRELIAMLGRGARR